MTDRFENESMLAEALRLLEHVELPTTSVLECTTKLLVNPARTAEDIFGKMVYVKFIVLVRKIDDNKFVIAFRSKDDDMASIGYAILDYEAGSYTPMTIDELFDFFAEPYGPRHVTIDQIASKALEVATLSSIFHPINH